MNIQEYLPYIIQIASTVIIFAFILGKYKVMFDHHEKILNRHEIAIDRILTRLDIMNTRIDSIDNDFSFMKGWMFSKSQESK